MAPKNAPTKTEGLEHQDQSIKARKTQLFEEREREETPASARRSFKEHVRQTPAAPLPMGIKAALWATAAVVVLLFLAALFLGGGSRSRGRRAALPPAPAAASRSALG